MSQRWLVAVSAVVSVHAFAPTSKPSLNRRLNVIKASASPETRRSLLSEGVALGLGVSTLSGFPLLSRADEVAAPPAPPAKVSYGDFPVPTEWGIKGKNYYDDATTVVKHMQYATQMDKGTPNMDAINKNMKKEMIDFVSFYRRFSNVAGKQSFSTLYTAINVLAGHYTSYGTKFPVPEKRRKRLYQEYAEIEKNIKKQR